ncbi:hypothetical protein [Streptomyces sp. NBC_01314]|uniref:hypothetical protein n=1 Tax=Streptomyces sp. NBC_01314 TaxID=2903821 RepID=UPI00352F11F2
MTVHGQELRALGRNAARRPSGGRLRLGVRVVGRRCRLRVRRLALRRLRVRRLALRLRRLRVRRLRRLDRGCVRRGRGAEALLAALATLAARRCPGLWRWWRLVALLRLVHG